MSPVAVDLSALLAGAADLYRHFPAGAADEVADRLAALAPSATGALMPGDPAPPVSEYLQQALASPARHALAASVPADPVLLPWQEGKFVMPAGFKGRYMFCVLVGPEEPVRADDMLFGLYMQAPNTDYPSHAHAAVEYYAVLSGEADWERNRDGYAPQPPGSCILHASYQWHAMRTGCDPLLAIWAWTGDLATETYKMME